MKRYRNIALACAALSLAFFCAASIIAVFSVNEAPISNRWADRKMKRKTDAYAAKPRHSHSSSRSYPSFSRRAENVAKKVGA